MKHLRTPLSTARGLGSAKSGLHHWVAQRITAVALIFLAVWFVSALLSATSQGGDIIDLVAHPFHAIALVLFIGVALYHGSLGLQVVIEDYVHCNCAKSVLLLGVKFIALISAVAAILAIVTFHVNAPTKPAAYGSHMCDKAAGDCHRKPCHKGDKEDCQRAHKGEKAQKQLPTDVAPEGAVLIEDIIIIEKVTEQGQ